MLSGIISKFYRWKNKMIKKVKITKLAEGVSTDKEENSCQKEETVLE